MGSGQAPLRRVNLGLTLAESHDLLPADVRDPRGLPPVRLAGAALSAPAAGDRRDDRGRDPRPVFVRRPRAGGADISCFRPNRGPCSTPWRRPASRCTCSSSAWISAATNSRRTRQGAVAVSVSGIVVPFIVAILATPWLHERAGAVRVRRLALQRHDVPRRGHRHHRISGAGAHHSRSRPRGDIDRHAGAVGRGHRRRRRLVRGRRGARQAGRRCGYRRAGHRRRDRARRRAHLVRAATVRAAGASGRAPARGRSAAEPDGAGGRP